MSVCNFLLIPTGELGVAPMCTELDIWKEFSTILPRKKRDISNGSCLDKDGIFYAHQHLMKVMAPELMPTYHDISKKTCFDILRQQSESAITFNTFPSSTKLSTSFLNLDDSDDFFFLESLENTVSKSTLCEVSNPASTSSLLLIKLGFTPKVSSFDLVGLIHRFVGKAYEFSDSVHQVSCK
jgi:hypothetical protein